MKKKKVFVGCGLPKEFLVLNCLQRDREKKHEGEKSNVYGSVRFHWIEIIKLFHFYFFFSRGQNLQAARLWRRSSVHQPIYYWPREKENYCHTLRNTSARMS